MAKLQQEKQASEAKHGLATEALERSVPELVMQSMSLHKLEEQPEKVADPLDKHSCIMCSADANYALVPCPLDWHGLK